MDQALKFFDLNSTDAVMILVCVVLFSMFVSCCSKFLVRPYLDLQDARDAASSGAQDQADQLIAKGDELSRQYEEALNEARVEGIRRRLEEVQSAQKKAESLVNSAEADAQRLTEAGHQELESHRNQVRSRLLGEADQMAASIAEKLLAPRATVKSIS